MSLLLVVLACGCVLAVGGWWLHRAQVKAATLRARAAGMAAWSAGRWSDAARDLGQYVVREPSDVEALLRCAHALTKLQPLGPDSMGRAAVIYERVLQLQPGHETASHRLAELYMVGNEPGEARRIAQARLSVARDDVLARLALAKSMMALGQFDESVQQLRRAIDLDPRLIDAYELLGVVQAQHLGRQDDAKQTFALLIRKNPDSPRAHLVTARFKRRQGDVEGASASLRAAEKLQVEDAPVLLFLGNEWGELGETDKARRHLEAAAQKIPRDPKPYAALLDLELREHRIDKALATLACAEKNLSDMSDVLPRAVQCYLAAGRGDRAAQCVRELEAKQAPQELVRFLGLLVEAGQGNVWRAIAGLTGMVAARPELAEVWRELGRLHATVRDWRGSVRAYRRYVQLRPESRNGRLALIEALLGDRDFGQAQRVAADAGPDDPKAALLWCHAQLGRLAEEDPLGTAGFEQLATDAYDFQVRFPQEVGFVLVRAEALANAGEADAAATLLTQARSRHPDDVSILLALGELHRRQGRPREGAAVFLEALAGSPGRLEARMSLAYLYAERGDIEAAVSLLQEGLQEARPEAQTELWLAIATVFLEAGHPESSLGTLENRAREAPYDARIRLAMLAHPALASDRQRAQSIVDELRDIEGETGLNWRWQQARLWLDLPDRQGRADELAELLAYCVRADPGWIQPTAALARLHVEQGKVDEAIRLYGQLLSHVPESTEVAELLLRLLSGRGRYEQARQILARFDDREPALLPHRVEQALRDGDRNLAVELLQARLADDPGDTSAMGLLAEVYLGLGRLDDAERVVRATALSAPGNVAGTKARVELALARRLPDDALAYCDDLVRLDGSFDAHWLRAETRVRTGHLPQAEDDYRKLTAIEDRTAEAYTLLGDFLQGLGREGEAVEAYRVAAHGADSSTDARRKLAGLLLASGEPANFTEAKRLLTELLQHDPSDGRASALMAAMLVEEGPEGVQQARGILNEAVERDPHAVEAWQMLVRLSLAERSATSAERILDRALAANPTSIPLLLERAEVLAPRQPLLAIQSARRAVDFEPGNATARVGLAKAMRNAGQIDEAVDMLGAWLAAARGLEAVPALGLHAELLCRKDRVEEAQASLRRAESLAPWHPAVVRAKLLVAVTQGQVEQAEALAAACLQRRGNDRSLLLEAASILLPQDSPPLVEAARRLLARVAEARPDTPAGWLGAAVAAHKLGRVDLAEAAFRKALETSPDNAAAVNGLAWVLCEDRGDPRSALPVADQGVKRWPRDVHLLDTRGVILFRLGRLEEAKRGLLDALDLASPQSSTAAAVRFHLARVLAAKGERDEARKHLEESLTMADRWGGLSAQEQAEARLLSQQL